MHKQWAIVAGLALWSGALTGGERGKGGHDGDKDHVIVKPGDIKWGPAPPSLPSGAKFAVLSGDPSKSGLYVIRAQLPAGYKIPPHWHPTDENVTILKGTFMIGRGDKFSESDAEALPAGSFMRMPKTMRHFAWAKDDTTLQVHGMGPFEITYVNAADDPRKK